VKKLLHEDAVNDLSAVIEKVPADGMTEYKDIVRHTQFIDTIQENEKLLNENKQSIRKDEQFVAALRPEIAVVQQNAKQTS